MAVPGCGPPFDPVTPPVVSVVMPVHNGRRFLERALKSVWAQTRQPCEVIVVDDASTDGSREALDSLASSAPLPLRILALCENSGGPARPLNRGIAAATGDWIALLEQDDTMLPHRLELQSQAARLDPPADFAFGRCIWTSEDDYLTNGGTESPRLDGEVPLIRSSDGLCRVPALDAYRGLVRRQYALTCSTYFFRKKLWEACGGFDERIVTAADYDFAEKAARRGDLAFVDEPIIRWFYGPASLLQSSRPLTRAEDRVHLVKRFDKRRLGFVGRRARRGALREGRLAAAYFSVRERKFGRAFVHYAATCLETGWSWEAVFGLVKLGPRAIGVAIGGRYASRAGSGPTAG